MEDEERSKRIRVAAVRWTWASLAVVCFLGVVIPLSAVFRWWDVSVMCLLGFVTGIVLSYALLHSEQHEHVLFYAALMLGLFLLPAIAVSLGGVAAGTRVFANLNATLTAFVVYALATLALCLTLATLWRPRETEQETQSEQVEQLAEWQLLQGESPPERPLVELTPPAQPPAQPPVPPAPSARAQGG